jgi:hypothetical protein
MISAQNPNPWMLKVSKTTGRQYYYNEVSQESTYDQPADFLKRQTGQAQAEREQPTVLVIDGGHYQATHSKVTAGTRKICDMTRFLVELAGEVGASRFDHVFWFQGTEDGRSTKFHECLKHQHVTVCLKEMKFQNGRTADGNKVSIKVEKSVDVAIATKLLQCAHGFGGEPRARQIFVVTGDGDFLPAFEAATNAREMAHSVFVVSGKDSCSTDLLRFQFLKASRTQNREATFLDDAMERSLVDAPARASTPSVIRRGSSPAVDLMQRSRSPAVDLRQRSRSPAVDLRQRSTSPAFPGRVSEVDLYQRREPSVGRSQPAQPVDTKSAVEKSRKAHFVTFQDSRPAHLVDHMQSSASSAIMGSTAVAKDSKGGQGGLPAAPPATATAGKTSGKGGRGGKPAASPVVARAAPEERSALDLHSRDRGSQGGG